MIEFKSQQEADFWQAAVCSVLGAPMADRHQDRYTQAVSAADSAVSALRERRVNLETSGGPPVGPVGR